MEKAPLARKRTKMIRISESICDYLFLEDIFAIFPEMKVLNGRYATWKLFITSLREKTKYPKKLKKWIHPNLIFMLLAASIPVENAACRL
jgi:hypothetical protein